MLRSGLGKFSAQITHRILYNAHFDLVSVPVEPRARFPVRVLQAGVPFNRPLRGELQVNLWRREVAPVGVALRVEGGKLKEASHGVPPSKVRLSVASLPPSLA